MAGYDDTKIIAQVRDMLVADPSMSRRSAIIAVAREQNLRRIEIKMSRMEAEAPFALDAERRRAVAAEHAGRYPLTLRTGHIEAVFLAAHPRDEYGNGACSLGFLGEHLIASVAATRETAVTRLDLTFLDLSEILTGLSALGIIDLGEGPAWPNPGGPCHRRLSEALVSSWRAANLGGHLDDTDLLAEAAAFEDARFVGAGFDVVASRFPPGFGLAMSPVAKALGRKRLDADDAEIMSRWLRSEPGAVDLAIALGPLSGVLANSHSHQRFDAGETTSENLWAMLRTNCIDTETGVTPDDIAWCLDLFGGTLEAPLLTEDTVLDLIAEREWIDSLGPLDPNERAAIATIVASSDVDALGRRDRDGLFWTLRSLIPAMGSPSLLHQALGQAAVERDMTVEKVLKTLRIDLSSLYNSLHRHMMLNIRQAMAGMIASDFNFDEILKHRIIDCAIGKSDFEGGTLSAILSNRNMVGVVNLVLDWVAAGRPGYALAREPAFEDAWNPDAQCRNASQRDVLLDLVVGMESSANWRRFMEILTGKTSLGDTADEPSEDAEHTGAPSPSNANEASDLPHPLDQGAAAHPERLLPLPWWRKPVRIAAMLIGKRAA